MDAAEAHPSNSRVWSINDMSPESRHYLEMPKDVLRGGREFKWPLPGRKLSIELQSEEDRKTKFFLDLCESKRSTSVLLGVEADRKSTAQSRVGSFAVVRLDMADNQEILRHRNPDGSVLVGSHVHLDIVGYGMRFAWPLDGQTVLSPSDGSYSVQSMFDALLTISKVDKRLEVNYSLGV